MVFADSSAKQDYPLVDDFAKRRSYATPTIVWSKDNWIIADLQKAHRAAKKLPDKQGKFCLVVSCLSFLQQIIEKKLVQRRFIKR